MKTIYKFPIDVITDMQIQIPHGAKFLFCSLQNSEPQMWFEVDDNNPREWRYFKIHGTGHIIGEREKYLGTYLSGVFVWHLYEYSY